MRKHTHFALFLLLLLTSICPRLANAETKPDITTSLKTVRENLKPLNLKATPEHTDPQKIYFRYYGLDIENTQHHFGTFKSGKETIVAHIFIPEKSIGTVLISHGYYDHAGTWKHVIADLTKRNFTVAIYDQPGHGLSSGKEASINNFSEYMLVLTDFMNLCKSDLPGPYHLAAHSTGAGIALDHLLSNPDSPIDKAILIAPLIHSAMWKLSGFGNKLSGKVTDSVPRVFRRNSSDKAYLTFVKGDPLQAMTVPDKWIKAQRQWADTITATKTISKKEILILQGKKDTTVDWKYNIPFIQKHFPNAKTITYKKGQHQLINESTDLRNDVLKAINTHLTKQ